MKEDAYWIRDQVKAHTKWFEESLPMIASENLMSPLAKEMMISDFHDRYAEGLPGKRYYQGNIYVDKVELKCLELARKIFKAQFVDVRPISGTVANIAVLFALSQPGDKIATPELASGAHISTAPFGAVGLRGLNPVHYPWDYKNWNLDVDATRKFLKKERPKVAQFGLSVFLFPTPIKEIQDALQEAGSVVWYDAAHVLGLIAGGKFQDPLREGVHVISASTHKTFPGPNHGIIIADKVSDDVQAKLAKAAFPGVTSSHHLHAMAALAVTMAEYEIYGKQYAGQVIKNAKALGSALYEMGLDVQASHLGFTESHTLAVSVAKNGGGPQVALDLEKANIIVNKNMLPGDTSAVKPSGIRLGTQELTRLGMEKGEMEEVARLIYRVVVKKEDPQVVKKDAWELKKEFTKVRYCLNEGEEAYRYKELV
ncbi:serine hydroxymethyltransferase [Methanomassiliicoccus luminyensis]|uniref:serine hydroxymethyltransferase n=1 Tax=Methanomassiliicoccus luminyensis TaxID=1080712 RepID=UPI00036CD340|nr:serine hydroxymethyltransferase [Methanomassiliicoccus luminyensis]